jgi:hypothetical protein
MSHRFALLLAAATLFVPAILLSDGPGFGRQVTLALLTGAFLLVAARVAAVDRTAILAAIVVATLGEVVLSIAWGLYSYRFTTLVPLYVPVGHGLFYTLAAGSAAQRWMRQHATAITRSVLLAGSAIAAGSLLLFHDQWGLLWWIAAALLIARSRSHLLLSLCCAYTMLLEWTGTWIGNWRWAPLVPFVGLHSANPPSGVGILYVLLDLITVALCTAMLRRNSRIPFRAPLPIHGPTSGATLHVHEATRVGPKPVLTVEIHGVAGE